MNINEFTFDYFDNLYKGQGLVADSVEKLNDVKGVGLSNCCGAEVYAPTDEWAVCLKCKEYCDEIK